MTLQLDGTTYDIVECGGEGNCLFLSLAYVFKDAEVLVDGEDGTSLRQRSIDALTVWGEHPPGWFDEQGFEVPSDERIGNLIDGDEGDLTSLLGVLAGKAPDKSPYGAVRVTVVWWDDDQDQDTEEPSESWVVSLEPAGIEPETDVLILWRGGVHYQALVESDEEEGEGGEGEAEAESGIVASKGKSETRSSKLSSGGLSSSITTLHSGSVILEIHVLDVGQGESSILLLKHSGKIAHAVVIDGGKETLGGGTLLRCLTGLGVTNIDLVVASHYDADHLEGLTMLLSQWKAKIGQIWIPVALTSSKGLDEGLDEKPRYFAQAFSSGKIPTNVPKDNQSISFHELTITCLCAGMGVGFAANNHSIALLVQFGGFRYYTAGDLESTIEDDLEVAETGHVCAMKCGHHGSCGSSSKPFLKKAKPRVTLISSGKHGYCHPDDKLIARLCKVRSMQAFYLTNCCYNRAGINPNYAEDFEKEKVQIAKLIEEQKTKAKEGVPVKESKRGKRKFAKEGVLAKARRQLGVVAGDTEYLGNIVIRVDADHVRDRKHLFHVGHHDRTTKKWAWHAHRCSGASLESASIPKDDLSGLVHLESLAKLTGDSKAWIKEVKEFHAIPPFSILTKPPGERREGTKPLEESEFQYAMGEDLASEPEGDSDFSGDDSPRTHRDKRSKEGDGKKEK